MTSWYNEEGAMKGAGGWAGHQSTGDARKELQEEERMGGVVWYECMCVTER
jgi:hypothetical protein